MIRLVSYNAHGNGVSVFNDTKNNVFYKVAFADSSAVFGLKKKKLVGIGILIMSYVQASSQNIQKEESYARLEIVGFEGKKIRYTELPENTITYVERFVDYYLSFWPKNRQYAYHGI